MKDKPGCCASGIAGWYHGDLIRRRRPHAACCSAGVHDQATPHHGRCAAAHLRHRSRNSHHDERREPSSGAGFVREKQNTQKSPKFSVTSNSADKGRKGQMWQTCAVPWSSHSSYQAATRLGYVDKRLSSYADTWGETLPWWTRSAGFGVFKRSWPFKHQRIRAACSEKWWMPMLLAPLT